MGYGAADGSAAGTDPLPSLPGHVETLVNDAAAKHGLSADLHRLLEPRSVISH
jgi:hypothetical protein